MKKSLGVVAGVVVVAGVAWVGASWYTGKRVEAVVRQSVDDGNAKLQALLPNAKIKIAVNALERHVFSSDIQYSLVIEGVTVEKDKPVQDVAFLLHDHVEHGPFPLARLKTGALAPVMATSAFELVNNDTVKPWFDLTKGVAPFSGNATIHYSRDVDGNLTLQPVKVQHDDADLDFSGMTLQVATTYATKAAKVSGNMDSVSLDIKDAEQPGKVQVSGLALNSDMHQGQAGLQVGTNQLAVKQISIVHGTDPTILLNNYTQNAELIEGAGGMSARVMYDVGMLNVGSQDIAGLRLGFGARNLASDAVKTLVELYGNVFSRTLKQKPGDDPEQAFDLPPEERQKAIAAGKALLAGNPTFFIDPILVRNAKGESRFNLTLDLGDPGSTDQPVDQMVTKLLRKLDAKVVVSTPMVTSIVAQQLQQQGKLDAATAQRQAEATTQALAQMAVATGYLSKDGDNVVGTLGYADKVVDLNGKKMPLEEFAMMVAGMAMGMHPDEGMDEEDPDAPDADEGDDAEDAAKPGAGAVVVPPPARAK
ncbi:YdgA family protein [Achromobacter aloeverae]|uniref:DUF945 domain-containing protein n=1 Tax=Achromobacter aloeverae TaxID=1750518 RepID=A0A4Q1HKY9_9BURK|nr:YdgA family protein [Achromobacter aloeverae]RXN90148.1 hypothetical protein C7R54_11460 [Achromobacter aloeverae]